MRLQTSSNVSFKLSHVLHHIFVTAQILKKVFLVVSSKLFLLNKYPQNYSNNKKRPLIDSRQKHLMNPLYGNNSQF